MLRCAQNPPNTYAKTYRGGGRGTPAGQTGPRQCSGTPRAGPRGNARSPRTQRLWGPRPNYRPSSSSLRPKDIDPAFLTFSWSALFAFWGSSGGGASWVASGPGVVGKSFASFRGLGIGASFVFSGRGGLAQVACRCHRPPSPVGCGGPGTRHLSNGRVSRRYSLPT
jgi:hypothetical protein